MNPLGGGIIPQNPKLFEFVKTRKDETVVEAALRFFLAHQEISVILVGMRDASDVKEAVRAAEGYRDVGQAELDRIAAAAGQSFQGLCTGCQYCDGCPEEIPVPKLMDAYNRVRGRVDESRRTDIGYSDCWPCRSEEDLRIPHAASLVLLFAACAAATVQAQTAPTIRIGWLCAEDRDGEYPRTTLCLSFERSTVDGADRIVVDRVTGEAPAFFGQQGSDLRAGGVLTCQTWHAGGGVDFEVRVEGSAISIYRQVIEEISAEFDDSYVPPGPELLRSIVVPSTARVLVKQPARTSYQDLQELAFLPTSGKGTPTGEPVREAPSLDASIVGSFDPGDDVATNQAPAGAVGTLRASRMQYLGTTADGLSLVILGTDEYDMVPIFSLTVYVVAAETGTIRRTIRAETYPQTEDERRQKAALEAEIAGMGLRAGLVALDEGDFRLVYSESKSDLGLFRYEVSFRLWHQPSDQSIDLGVTLIDQTVARSIETREAWRTLDGNTWCFTYRTPGFMEGCEGEDGVWVIDRLRLSELMNRVGYSYYTQKRYSAASDWFERATELNPLSAKATYNAACMRALHRDSAGATAWLDRLIELDTADARGRLAKVWTDSDFDPIRDVPSFARYLTEMIPRPDGS